MMRDKGVKLTPAAVDTAPRHLGHLSLENGVAQLEQAENKLALGNAAADAEARRTPVGPTRAELLRRNEHQSLQRAR